jgi:hypothetical protein
MWRKSSYCNGASSCVEVRRLPDGRVVLRDSKDPDGPALTLTASEWVAFIAGVEAGEFDPTVLAPDGNGLPRACSAPLASSCGDSVPA